MSDDYGTQVAALQVCFENLLSLPSANVSTIIRKNPSSACAEALAAAFLSSSQFRPLSIDVLVQSLVAELSLTTDIVFTDTDAGYFNVPFNDIFEIDFADYLATDLLELYLHKSKQTVVSPQNTVLSSALLLASVARNGLLGWTLVNEFVDQGLQLPGALTVEKKKKEVVAIGACLLLLVAGSMFADTWSINEDRDGRLGKVTEALEALRQVVKYYPTGQDLLEKTIDVAKGGFKAETTAAEAWELLFPLTQSRCEEVAWPTLRSLGDYIGQSWFRTLVPEIKPLQNGSYFI